MRTDSTFQAKVLFRRIKSVGMVKSVGRTFAAPVHIVISCISRLAMLNILLKKTNSNSMWNLTFWGMWHVHAELFLTTFVCRAEIIGHYRDVGTGVGGGGTTSNVNFRGPLPQKTPGFKKTIKTVPQSTIFHLYTLYTFSKLVHSVSLVG
jgi:hypothetical protein